MSWLPTFVTIISGSCYLSNLIKWSYNPWCASIRGQDKNDIVKALLMAPVTAPAMANMPGTEGAPGAPSSWLQADEESALLEALTIITSHSGLAAMSEAELDSFLAGLDAPEPTTMLTVAKSMPTM